MRPETVVRIHDDGTVESRLNLTQDDRDALFDPMFSMPKDDVAWEIEALDDGYTRIKLCRMPRSKANVPTLEMSGAWYELVDAITAYRKRFYALNPNTGSAQQTLPI